MTTSMQTFSFLASLVTEIIKTQCCWSPLTPPSGQIFTCSHTTYKCLPAY